MKEGPDIAIIGSLIGDPARANMLGALMNGMALTASELAEVAGITAQTASTHLRKLEDGGLLTQRKQGRHRYFCLADDQVAQVLESLSGLAENKGHKRVRTGPKDPAMRHARVCYDHLAGEVAVQMYDVMAGKSYFQLNHDALILTDSGQEFFQTIGIEVGSLKDQRRPLCKPCLDWSERRTHLAGTLGKSLLDCFLDNRWARREADSRVINFTARGRSALCDLFDLQANSL